MGTDGHTLTLRLPANNLDTLHQVFIRNFNPFNQNVTNILSSISDVSYTKTQRTRSTSSSFQSLPVHMTLVGCYSTNERLTDCTYHEFSSSITTSMDVRISCGVDSADKDSAVVSDDDDSTDDDSDGSTDVDSAGVSDELNSVSVASLSVAVICASVVIILVAVLIIMYMLRQKKKKHTIR